MAIYRPDPTPIRTLPVGSYVGRPKSENGIGYSGKLTSDGTQVVLSWFEDLGVPWNATMFPESVDPAMRNSLIQRLTAMHAAAESVRHAQERKNHTRVFKKGQPRLSPEEEYFEAVVRKYGADSEETALRRLQWQEQNKDDYPPKDGTWVRLLFTPAEAEIMLNSFAAHERIRSQAAVTAAEADVAKRRAEAEAKMAALQAAEKQLRKLADYANDLDRMVAEHNAEILGRHVELGAQ